MTDALRKNDLLVKEQNEEEGIMAKAQQETGREKNAETIQIQAKKRPAKKLITEEEIAVGHVGWDAGKL